MCQMMISQVQVRKDVSCDNDELAEELTNKAFNEVDAPKDVISGDAAKSNLVSTHHLVPTKPLTKVNPLFP